MKDSGDNSDDSSSMGDGGYLSPSSLDSEEESTTRKRPASDALLTHRPHKFVKATKASTPSVRRGRKKNTTNTIQSKLLQLERQKQAKKPIQRKRPSSALDSSDESDSDSDIEIVGTPSKGDSKTNGTVGSRRKAAQPKEPETIELLELLDSSPESSPAKEAAASKALPPRSTRASTKATTTAQAIDLFDSSPESAAKAANATTKEAIDLLDSDDDDEDIPTSFSSKPILPPALAASLEQAQQAKARLEQAQVYHAQDVHVAVQETLFVPKATPPPQKRSAASIDIGKTLSFACRCGNIAIGGQKHPIPKDQQSTILTVREKEPLSALVEKFCLAHSLPQQQAKIILKFDGQNLNHEKTPTFYDMEDEDLIDVSASAPFRSNQQQRTSSPQAKTSKRSLGKSMAFSCRTKITKIAPKRRGKPPQNQAPSKPTMVTKTVGLCENETLGVLAKRLCKNLGEPESATTKMVMRFDGIVLNTEKTPKFYDMEDGDMIEVSIEK